MKIRFSFLFHNLGKRQPKDLQHDMVDKTKRFFKKIKKERKKQKKKKKKKKIEQQTRYSLFEYGNDCVTLIHAHDERTAIRVFSDQW